MQIDLTGKKALVTGASRGLGRAIALSLARAGADVVITYEKSADKAQAVADEIKALGRHGEAVQADSASAQAIQDAVTHAARALGGLDILVNNAGIWLQGWCQEIPLEDWQRSLDVNLTGPFLTSQYFAKSNLDKGRPGRIININSQAAFNGSTTGHAHYAASKAGMVALTISMARELSPRGITVNGVALGIVATDMTKESRENKPGYYESRIPLGRVAEPEDIAGIVVFMASEPAGYLTGTTIDATGGMLMR